MYAYDPNAKTLDFETPLVVRAEILAICKEIDEDTPLDEIASFITTGHNLLCMKLDGWGVPESVLKEIEKYLAAHFAATTYPPTQREGLGPLTRAYVTKIDLDLRNTRYGQMAIALDPTGELAIKKGRVVLKSIGSGILVP